MARQIECDRRATQRKSDIVPCVGILPAAVEKDDFGRAVSPFQSRYCPAFADVDGLSLDTRRGDDRHADLCRDVREEAEFVIVGTIFVHNRTSLPGAIRRGVHGTFRPAAEPPL
jgi:hypothetical protein